MMQESQQGDNSSNDSTKGPSNLPAKNADANTQTGWKQMQWKTKREKKAQLQFPGQSLSRKIYCPSLVPVQNQYPYQILQMEIEV